MALGKTSSGKLHDLHGKIHAFRVFRFSQDQSSGFQQAIAAFGGVLQCCEPANIPKKDGENGLTVDLSEKKMKRVPQLFVLLFLAIDLIDPKKKTVVQVQNCVGFFSGEAPEVEISSSRVQGAPGGSSSAT